MCCACRVGGVFDASVRAGSVSWASKGSDIGGVLSRGEGALKLSSAEG